MNEMLKPEFHNKHRNKADLAARVYKYIYLLNS